MSYKLNLFDAAHTIRYHLNELLNEKDAEKFDHDLTAILDKARSDIRELIKRHETTAKWTHKFLYPDDDTKKSYLRLPGESDNAIGGLKKYVCPEPHCTEYCYQREAGQKMLCIIHKIPLIESDKKEKP